MVKVQHVPSYAGAVPAVIDVGADAEAVAQPAVSHPPAYAGSVMSPETLNGRTAVLAGVDGSTPLPVPHSMVDSSTRVAGVRPTIETVTISTAGVKPKLETGY